MKRDDKFSWNSGDFTFLPKEDEAATAQFSQEPASEEVALPGVDGERADKLLQEAKDEGSSDLAGICRQAYKRVVEYGAPSFELFNAQERADLTESMLACVLSANLLGRSSTILKFMRDVDESRKDRFADETPFDFFAEPIGILPPMRAINYFKKLLPMLDVDPVHYVPEMRRYAFTLAVATEKTLLVKVQKILVEAMDTGTLDQEFKIKNLMEKTGVAPANPQYANMVYRTNMMDAYTTGQTDQAKDPIIQESFPVWRYDGIRDGRQGKDHEPHFGKYYPSQVAFADVRGKRPFNCRCAPTMIYKSTWQSLQDRGFRVESSW